MNRGLFSSGYGCYGNQENGVFAVSMATAVKGKNSCAYFIKLMWTSIPYYFFRKNVATRPIVSHY